LFSAAVPLAPLSLQSAAVHHAATAGRILHCTTRTVSDVDLWESATHQEVSGDVLLGHAILRTKPVDEA
jgi:hypothetical protein